MLRLLRIVDFAIIDSLEVAFGPGLNVLTGETGAGKSIIFEALHLTLGARASGETVRAGAKEAEVETLFDLPPTDAGRAARAVLEEAGVPLGSEKELLVRRRVSASGRSRVYLNDRLTTAATLGAAGERLVNIHGQHAHQSLLRPGTHLELLDNFAGLGGKRAALGRQVAAMHAAQRVLDGHRNGARERAQRADLMRFQIEELERESISPGEMKTIEAELPRLRNAGHLREIAAGLFASLYESEGSVIERTGEALRGLERIVELDPAQAPLLEEASSALAQVESLAAALRDYAERIEADPDRLETLEGRRIRLREMFRKYGDGEEECLAYLERARAELAGLMDEDGTETQLAAEMERLRTEIAGRAQTLSTARRKSARELDKGMKKDLAELDLRGAIFETRLETQPEEGAFIEAEGRCVGLRSDGIDRCSFFFSPNPGEPPRPLARIASGGELSRLMLALEAELRRGGQIPTLVFDEVDAGIGGAVAEVVGRKLLEVSRNHQVLVITHLPQIASLADRHYRIEKCTAKGRTTASIEPVSGEARVEEIARMGAGLEITEAARRHAREMLRGAEKTGAKG